MTLLDGKVDVRFCYNHGPVSQSYGPSVIDQYGGAKDGSKLQDPKAVRSLDNSITLLCNGSNRGTPLRFMEASSHRRQTSFQNSTDIECFSDSSEDTSCSDDDTFEGGGSTSDESSSFSDMDIEEALHDSKNGFAFSLVKIQSMRFGVSVSELETSAHMAQEISSAPVVDSTLSHPRDTYRKILLEEVGAFSHRSFLVVPRGFFVVGDVQSHTLELMTAVRQGNVETIKAMKAQALNLQCRNRFNETIVHTAARRGQFEILRYLIEEAGVSPRVCCDTGRTPLHDAAWSGKPDFRTITLLLQDCSDFLSLTDSRKCTPFDYIPQSAYDVWNEYLEEHRVLLIPKGYF